MGRRDMCWHGSPLVLLRGRTPVDLPVQARILRCEMWELYQTLLHLFPLAPRAHTRRHCVQRPAAWVRVVQSGVQAACCRLVQHLGPPTDGLCGGSELFSLAKIKAHESLKAIAALEGPRHGIIHIFARFLPQVAEQGGRGRNDADTMMAKEQDEATAAVFECRFSRWPRHELHRNDERKVWTCGACWKEAPATRASRLRSWRRAAVMPWHGVGGRKHSRNLASTTYAANVWQLGRGTWLRGRTQTSRSLWGRARCAGSSPTGSAEWGSEDWLMAV